MTDARTTQVVGDVATAADDPVSRITQVAGAVSLVGSPELYLTALNAGVAVGSTAPRVSISTVCVQVLVSTRVKQNFQAIWIG